MFVIRQAKPEDTATLVKLARMVYFINLPPDEQIIAGKIAQSTRCFVKAGGGVPAGEAGGGAGRGSRGRRSSISGLAAMDRESDLFVFVIEDAETGAVIGTSQIRAHQGGPGNPNWSMRLSEKKFVSARLGLGTTHTVGKLYGDESGPTEIGGLILEPGFRGRRPSPGRFLSFVRFNFIGLHRALFADRVLAEMAPPVTASGDNVFWDHLGRKFIPVKYAEADRFCQHNRAFIAELFPKEEIYLTLFPLEVQNQIGAVSKDTVPARKLLEGQGFRARGFVDPFDAAPHLDVATDEIPLVKATRRGTLGRALPAGRCPQWAIVSVLSRQGEFRAVETACKMERSGVVSVPEEAMDLLGARAGVGVGVTPLERGGREGGRGEGERAGQPVRGARTKKTQRTT